MNKFVNIINHFSPSFHLWARVPIIDMLLLWQWLDSIPASFVLWLFEWFCPTTREQHYCTIPPLTNHQSCYSGPLYMYWSELCLDEQSYRSLSRSQISVTNLLQVYFSLGPNKEKRYVFFFYFCCFMNAYLVACECNLLFLVCFCF